MVKSSLLQDDSGFSLVEMLVVLSIFTIMITISIYLVKPKLTIVHEEQFMDTYINDIYYAQMFALENQVNSSFYINKEYGVYWLTRGPFRILFRKYLWPGVEFASSRSLKFSPNGNIVEFGRTSVIFPNKRLSIVFQIGRGRFYVEEIPK